MLVLLTSEKEIALVPVSKYGSEYVLTNVTVHGLRQLIKKSEGL